ncbi:MAG: class I SAM-dependent RNA methyltransferase [Oscillospiraceae bacterium]|nr:class I SAM-dependent RNA methyltransferase [Oscillospiraceae bacterium]
MDLLFCVPCLFGLEGLCADELKRLKIENVKTENGRVNFSGGRSDIAKVNINLRTGERVLLTVGDTKAESFDELFEGVRAMPWERYITADGAFPVKGHSLGSKLFSIPDCQKIIKKAIVEKLKEKHKIETLPETAEKYQIQFAIMNDIAVLYIDTSGAGLHKRGYRPVGNDAPLRETLAAAMVKLSRYRGKELVCDPFCGSGTIAIEAALAAINRAPGLNREFSAEKWPWPEKKIWSDAKDEAKSREFKGDYQIWGGDIDPKCIEISKDNAKRAGVSEYITFEISDATGFDKTAVNRDGLIVTNPPYGERVMQQNEAEELYRKFGAAVRKQKDWKMYILSSHTEFERTFGKTAVKKRKLYNGMIKCDLFMYY